MTITNTISRIRNCIFWSSVFWDWFYVFTVIIVLTFAIEIGQKVTGTGAMEFADIVFGIVGFIVMFLIFALMRAIYKGILQVIHNRNQSKDNVGEDE